MKLYTDYIWDFDGTLFDSYPHSAAALCAAAARFGLQADPERVMRLMRRSFAAAFEALGLNAEQQACFRAIRNDPDFPPPVVPFPEAPEALRRLKALGARHFLFTHSPRPTSVAYIEAFGLDGLFTGYMTPEEPGFVRKPDPGAILRLMRLHGIPAETAAMVGDREIDMRCAAAAGIDGILVDPDHLADDADAVHCCERLLDLIPY